MALAAVALVAVAAFATLLWQQRAHNTHTERREKEWAIERGAFLRYQADLLQRIQAPEQAVIDHATPDSPVDLRTDDEVEWEQVREVDVPPEITVPPEVPE